LSLFEDKRRALELADEVTTGRILSEDRAESGGRQGGCSAGEGCSGYEQTA
jgi:hypothetical protein